MFRAIQQYKLGISELQVGSLITLYRIKLRNLHSLKVIHKDGLWRIKFSKFAEKYLVETRTVRFLSTVGLICIDTSSAHAT